MGPPLLDGRCGDKTLGAPSFPCRPKEIPLDGGRVTSTRGKLRGPLSGTAGPIGSAASLTPAAEPGKIRAQ